MGKFIITIDTEGDDLWSWKEGMEIRTENIRFLPRFQQKCEEYGFKPFWLTNYEMIESPNFVEFISDVEERGTGELGMHLHAWNSPPFYDLQGNCPGNPYLIEYPYEIMSEKIRYITDLIFKRTGIRPVSHRAGRWATNSNYFDLLIRYGYKVDCSVTPLMNWSSCVGRTQGSAGTDYSDFPHTPYNIQSQICDDTILEVPVTTMLKKAFIMPSTLNLKSIGKCLLNIVHPCLLWIRPTGRNLNQIKYVIENAQSNYLMFMIHSSELMPGGSPNFKTAEEINTLYKHLDILFKELVSKGYEGCTLRQFEGLWRESKK